MLLIMMLCASWGSVLYLGSASVIDSPDQPEVSWQLLPPAEGGAP